MTSLQKLILGSPDIVLFAYR